MFNFKKRELIGFDVQVLQFQKGG